MDNREKILQAVILISKITGIEVDKLLDFISEETGGNNNQKD